MKMTRKAIHGCAMAIAAAGILSLDLGCSSDKKTQPPVEGTANSGVENRLLLQMALSEGVYNGIAAERSVYPKDFHPGTSTLNELGMRRVGALADACRGASGRITILRGDAPEPLYDARIAAVRQELADAGLDLERVTVAGGDHVATPGVSSGRALVTFDKMMSEYVAQPEGGGVAGQAAGVGSNSQTPYGRASSGAGQNR
jgi:hypothetical protein